MSEQIKRFEDFIAWQKAEQLAVQIYKIFRDNKDFSFRDQIRRAAVSISNNIAEGFERKSKRELVAFLYIAKSSCAEVKSMSHLARDLSYLDKEEYLLIYNLSDEISRLIYGLIRSLNLSR